jgi:hypothetical protein
MYTDKHALAIAAAFLAFSNLGFGPTTIKYNRLEKRLTWYNPGDRENHWWVRPTETEHHQRGFKKSPKRLAEEVFTDLVGPYMESDQMLDDLIPECRSFYKDLKKFPNLDMAIQNIPAWTNIMVPINEMCKHVGFVKVGG